MICMVDLYTQLYKEMKEITSEVSVKPLANVRFFLHTIPRNLGLGSEIFTQ